MRVANLDLNLFDDLASRGGEDLISIFIPTHRKGRELAQDRVHLKNQLSVSDEAMSEFGYKPREREKRLGKVRELLDDLEFWEHQGAGLAVFVDDDDGVVAVGSDCDLDPATFIMPVFMLRPLIGDIQRLSAPVLALTRDAVALFSATVTQVDPMDVELPSFDEVNWFVDRETQRQQHPDRVGTDRNRHGHEPSSSTDEDVARFLREVDSALLDFDSDTPLIVLGDDDLVSRFASHSERVTASPKNSGFATPIATEEVHRMVSDVISDLEAERVEAARATATDRLGEELATMDIEEALPAAVSGRVDSVVMARRTAPVWGRLDGTTLEVEIHESHQPGDVDLLDRLVVWARENGGAITSSETPIDGRPFIASFRY